ncbi:Cysteine proteinase rd21a [Thalictrum thalictroides]|uniref:Cysteine proteinase rd21a n=1 Tax=Thalictrum thalictroides TaxID=46969 RepID=A0A7J6WQU4_THATH|nr:Cysteine proteinase rd21a [Thalictrum thalictroides]
MGFFWSSLTIHYLLLLLLLSSQLHLSFSSDLFNSWCNQHSKTYSSEQEKLYRLKVFEDNLAFVSQHNNLINSTYTLQLNAFADLTHHEFKASRLGGLTSSPRLQSQVAQSESSSLRSNGFRDVPSSIDWREKGAVTPVKDQSSCGACWAFSSTGSIEGINQIVTGSLVSLSEQELVSCDKSYNSGCGGGLMDYAFQWIIKNNGIDTEEDYPYQGTDGICNKNKLKRRVVTIDSYTDVPESDEESLIQAAASQPVSVGICGSERSFQHYSKGIFTGPCSKSLDHAVVIVGYGSENGVDYWILKNSWGTSWGMKGYMHMVRNSGDKEGVCGINMLASYPVKTSPNPPPSPSPSPTKCSLLSSCGAGETCCCGKRLLGICFSWKCCQLDSAVCCKDHRSCCPHDYPICDTNRQQCYKRTGNSTLMKALRQKDSNAKFGGWRSLIEAWYL